MGDAAKKAAKRPSCSPLAFRKYPPPSGYPRLSSPRNLTRMKYDVDLLQGDLGPEEVAMNDWLEDVGPYISLPADSDPDGLDEDD